MKKTTKFLLVLAAVVAMTIGAVSTVMAADVTIDAATWEADKNGVYSAKDVDGNKIMRGWAQSNDSGRWYYFVNGQMQVNRFITTDNKTYYVGSDGAMVSGWLEFNTDMKVNVNGAGYNNVADAFGADALIGNYNQDGRSNIGTWALTKDTRYATVWCYFNEDGSMVKNSFKDVDGIWYYFDGPFCLIEEYSFYVGGDYKAFYGFDKSGAILSGWIAVPNTKDNAAGVVATGPNGKPATTTTDYTWTYYGDGCKQAVKGWLKDADGNWFYMVADEKAGVVALANTYFKDADGKYYYFNDQCYMSVGETIIYGGSADGGKDINVLTNTTGNILVTGTAMNVAKDKSLTLSFSGTGNLLTGIQSNMYYEDGDSPRYTVAVAVAEDKDADGNVTNRYITVKASKADTLALGTKCSGSFLLIDTKDSNKIKYFDNGVMVKNDTVVFGDKILAFNDKGVLVGSTAITLNGVKYVAGADKVAFVGKDADGNEITVGGPDIYYSVVTE